MILRTMVIALALALGSPISAGAQDNKVKVGYWTSGFSVGFGAVLEAGKFLESQGLEPEFVRFTDVNAPTKALLTNSIDVAFAASTIGAFTVAAEGAPIDIVLATQIAEASFIVKDESPIRTVADFKGKKIGMSPAGSATYAIATAVLERNFGLKTSDYTAVPGNEAPLLQFLQRGDIDAASLRAVTLAAVPDMKLRKLASVPDEWKKMTKSSSPPILGTMIVHRNFSKRSPEGLVKFIRGMIAASEFGRRETEKTAEILRKAANLDARDATAYARVWNDIYIASMESSDVATYKVMAQIFKASGTLQGDVPDSAFVTAPYEQAKRRP